MSILPTGEQHEISFADQTAVITEVGATLRRYTVGDRHLIHGFEADSTVSGGRGQNMIPWPNRIRDGRYVFDGVEQQLALTEPARSNASHGLARYVPWTIIDQQPDQVTHRVRIFAQPGWPGVLDSEITHQLSEDGLTVTVRATNVGSIPVPFGYAAHPYLTVGETTVDETELCVPAAQYAVVDDQLIPVSVESVDGTDKDLRNGPRLGSRLFDMAMTDLVADRDGRWKVRLSRGDRTTILWGDESMRWVQVFTGGPYRDRGVAVEPMTCGANAYNEGPTEADLIRLSPGADFVASWGIYER